MPIVLDDCSSEENLDFSSKPQEKKTTSLWRNFILFCVCFSVSHGSMSSVLDYASSELGASLASDAGSVLYTFYTLSALFIAKPLVMVAGPKYSMILGLFGLLCYIFSFFLALVLSPFKWGIFVGGAVIGGLGSGVVWTAQAGYYSRNAQQYAQLSQSVQMNVNANFAAIFAGIYLGFETLTALLATAVYLVFRGLPAWRPVVFGSYTILSMCAMILSTNIYPLDLEDENSEKWKNLGKDVLAVGQSMFRSKRLALLLPYQICFGLHAGFIGQYVNRKIVAEGVGDGYIGVAAALATLTATLLAAPYAKISNMTSKYFIMIFGAICFSFCGFILLVMSDAQLGTWAAVIPYYIIHGAARGVWENTSKAVVADYFEAEDERETAYAAVYFTSGIAGAIAYFGFDFMDRLALAGLNFAFPLLGLICYHFSYQNSPEHEMRLRERAAAANMETRTKDDALYITMNQINVNRLGGNDMEDDAQETTVTFNDF